MDRPRREGIDAAMTAKASEQNHPHKIELILAQLETLAPPDAILAQVLGWTTGCQAAGARMVAAIGGDPALRADLLAIARTTEGAPCQSVRSLQNAVDRLGLEEVWRFVVVRKMVGAFPGARHRCEDGGFDRDAFWRHSLAVAVAAAGLAGRLAGGIEPREAFACGWFHDLGKAALAAVVPKSFERIVRKADAGGLDIAVVERELLGVDHMVVGRRLAERWGLPGRLVECIWLHHQLAEALPTSVAGQGHVQLVRLADAIAREQRVGYSGNHCPGPSSVELAERLGVSEADRLEIAESLAEEVDARRGWIVEDGEREGSGPSAETSVKVGRESAASDVRGLSQASVLWRDVAYFSALRTLAETISPRASVREACGVGGAALQAALGVPAVVVFASGAKEAWHEVGFFDGGSTHEPRWTVPPGKMQDASAAVEMVQTGRWVTTPGRSLLPLVDRYRGKLGEGPVWLLPIVRDGRWIGGALFSMGSDRAAALQDDGDHLEGLSAAVGLTIEQARAQSAARALGDELAEVNRRLVGMQGALLRARNQEAIVAMASGAAHELNSPLAVISGRAQIVRERVEDGDVREAIDTIIDQAHACSDIVTELMEFAESGPPKAEAVDLGAVLQSLRAELVAAGLLEGDDLLIDVSSDTPAVWFDPVWLRRLFREVLDNAIEATRGRCRSLTVKATRHLTEDSVAVEVRDNGRGIPAEELGRVMDPFFSHRPAGRGRGLGLARVQRWLQQAGGSIRIESRPSRGTSVHLRLPRADSRSAGTGRTLGGKD